MLARKLHRWPLWSAVLFVLALLTNTEAALAQAYRLGPSDKVRLSVHEWRAAIGEIVEWKSLSEEFVVSPEGEVSLPLIGNLKAAGLTSTELSTEITNQIRARFNLGTPPVVALEIVQYRPFYITGDVLKPGEYPFRPGLTVLQAASVAGGTQRAGDLALMRIGRDVITQGGELQKLASEIDSLRVRKARLTAELNNQKSVTLPAELEARKATPGIIAILQQEQAILDARLKALNTEVEALEGLKEHLKKEVTSIGSRLTVQERENGLVQRELKTIAALVEKGLSSTPRQLGLERVIAQLEGERLRLETTLLKARQDISRTEISVLEARNKRANDIVASLREAETLLEGAQIKYKTAQGLLYEAEILAPQVFARRQGALREPRYKIVRTQGLKTQEFQSTETTFIEPGDTIKVELPLPDDIADAGAQVNPSLPRTGQNLAAKP